MPNGYKRVLEEQASRAKEEKLRQSVIDLIPSRTASHVNLPPEVEDDLLAKAGTPGNATPITTVTTKPPRMTGYSAAFRGYSWTYVRWWSGSRVRR